MELTIANKEGASLSGSISFTNDPTTTINMSSTTASAAMWDNWNPPILVNTNVFEDRIEFIWKKTSRIYTDWQGPTTQVYKIIYSCVDGKWNVSEPIIGEIIPATGESYEFEGTPV